MYLEAHEKCSLGCFLSKHGRIDYPGTPKDPKPAPHFVDENRCQQSAPVLRLVLTLASCDLNNSSFIPPNAREIIVFLQKKRDFPFSQFKATAQ